MKEGSLHILGHAKGQSEHSNLKREDRQGRFLQAVKTYHKAIGPGSGKQVTG